MNTLYDETLELSSRLIASSEVTVTESCKEIGVTKRWFYKFCKKEIRNPGVTTVQRLHDYLIKLENEGLLMKSKAA